MDDAEVLERAADLIDVHGWHQGTYNREGRLCALGAVREAVGATDRKGNVIVSNVALLPFVRSDRIALRISGHLSEMGVRDPATKCAPTVPLWNDAPERTQGEVTDVLRTVAKELRNGT